MACGDQFACYGPAQKARCASYQHLHGDPGLAPASTRSAHSARRERSIFELWRMSVGCWGTIKTATSGKAVAALTAAVSSGPASAERLTDGNVSITATA